MRNASFNVYKNILLFFVFYILSSFNNASAIPVQISELSAQQLYDKIRYIDILANRKSYQIIYDNLIYAGSRGSYDMYCTSCCIVGENNHRVAITFFSNKSGCVSKIVWYSQQGDSISRKAESITVGGILIALGLSNDEYKTISSNFIFNGHGRVWCYDKNRCFILESNIEQNSLRCTKITATNEKPSDLPIAAIPSNRKPAKSYPTTEDDIVKTR